MRCLLNKAHLGLRGTQQELIHWQSGTAQSWVHLRLRECRNALLFHTPTVSLLFTHTLYTHTYIGKRTLTSTLSTAYSPRLCTVHKLPKYLLWCIFMWNECQCKWMASKQHRYHEQKAFWGLPTSIVPLRVNMSKCLNPCAPPYTNP